ncbi:MAG TPA: cytochrome c biogenesis protein CcsA [Candidatus Binatia bacterium]
MANVLLAHALAFYLLSTVTCIVHVIAGQESMRRWALALLGCAFGVHALSLSVRAVLLGYGAITTFQEELSFIACIMVGAYLVMALVLAQRANLTVVGTLVTPLAFLFTLSAYAFNSPTAELPEQLQNVWLPAHVAPAFLGYAIFAIAFCLSLIYLLQEKQLKAKRKSDLFRRLPSLETLDRLNHRFVTWGFALFTIGIITGSLLAKETWGALWSWQPVELGSVITWMLYALLLHARTTGWRGRKAAALTIVGFIVLVVSFLGVNLIFPGKHTGTFD